MRTWWHKWGGGPCRHVFVYQLMPDVFGKLSNEKNWRRNTTWLYPGESRLLNFVLVWVTKPLLYAWVEQFLSTLKKRIEWLRPSIYLSQFIDIGIQNPSFFLFLRHCCSSPDYNTSLWWRIFNRSVNELEIFKFLARGFITAVHVHWMESRGVFVSQANFYIRFPCCDVALHMSVC